MTSCSRDTPPICDYNGWIVFHIELSDWVSFTRSSTTIPHYTILHPNTAACINFEDQLVLIILQGKVSVVKVIQNHRHSSHLPFTGVIKCINLCFYSSTCIILLAPVCLLHNTFLPTSSLNSLFLGSSACSHILLETAYELISDHTALSWILPKGESFGLHQIPVFRQQGAGGSVSGVVQ
jgi:hypothetical protein